MVDWDKVKKDKWQLRDGKTLRILSLDGGGIRGIFTAAYLAKLEEKLSNKICNCFDLITGTSTGGIIALGLSLGMPAKEILDLYLKNASNIFKPRLRGKFGILTTKYNNKGLIDVLKYTFKDKIMADALTMLCIPSVEHHKAKPKVFKTPHHENFFKDADNLMWKVALATSSAPIYFPAAQVTGLDCKLDGGLWANNPVLVGFAEGCFLGYSRDQIKILSIGTGSHIYSANNKIAMKGGLICWNTKIVDLTMQVQTTSAEYIAKYLLKNNLIRINCVTKHKIDLDSTKKKHFNELLHEADEEFAKSYKNVFEHFNGFNIL